MVCALRTPGSAAIIQAFWTEFHAGVARCPRDRAPLALGVCEVNVAELLHAYRFVCVSCGWSSNLFGVSCGVIRVFPAW